MQPSPSAIIPEEPNAGGAFFSVWLALLLGKHFADGIELKKVLLRGSVPP
jgi:hypothetical protein